MGRKSRSKSETRERPATIGTSPVAPGAWSSHDFWMIGALIAITILVYGQVASHQFLNYDDGQFIYENAAVRDGLKSASVTWAITSASIGWYPLTWLSHELDVQLWGLDPSGHLLTQVFLHLANTILLFLALRRMTNARIRSGFAAALFAIHPMHVESVAWASERKDTLSTLFAILALYVYADRNDTARKKVIIMILLAASLMAKQMYVTLPFLFMVLDWWPLQRGLRIAEKVPLVGLSVIASAAALLGQRNLKAFQSVQVLSISARFANAIDGYVRYVAKLFFPVDLAVPYPMTEVPGVHIVLGLAVLTGMTAGAWSLRRRAPYLLTGWLWFLGTLVPVIGIIQIGPQSIADRYTYFAYIGLFIALVWAISELLPWRTAMTIGVLAVTFNAGVAWHQVRYWKNSESLFQHVLEVTGPNPVAEYSLGQALQLNAPERALPHLQRSIDLVRESRRTHPAAAEPEWYAQSYVAMATAKLMQARLAAANAGPLIDSAESDLHQALMIDPHAAHAENNLKVAAVMRQQLIPAAEGFASFMQRGGVLANQKRFEDAVEQFRKATAIAPVNVKARIYLAIALVKTGKNADAVSELREAEKLDPNEANRILTSTLQLPESETNLSEYIARISS